MQDRCILHVVLSLLLTGVCLGSHFRGGIIMWEHTAVDKQIKVTYRIAWRRSFSGNTYCDENTKTSGALRGQGNMYCLSGCTGTVGTMLAKCTDYSVAEDWFSGENTYIYNSNAPTDGFIIGFTGGAWISVVYGGGSWRLAARVDLTKRNDTGRANNSPKSAVSPIIRIQYGCNATIEIPVNDLDGDTVRCRWATSKLNECAGVCQTFVGADLDEQNCKIFYSATDKLGWYAVALQVEDYVSGISTEPLSSVPLQFLVNVFSADKPCDYKSEFLPPTRIDGSCVGVPFNSTFEESIIAKSGDDSISITEINTVSPLGMKKSPLEKYSGADRSWYINVTWSPTNQQQGSNIFCFSATDSAKIDSKQRCITLLGGVSPPRVVEGSQSPSGDVLPQQTVWKIDFDSEFIRPNRSTYMYIYYDDNKLLSKVDVSTAPQLKYPEQSLNRTLSITFPSGYVLPEKTRFYILLDEGVARGTTYCGAESPAYRDKTFWTFRIRDITPPVLNFDNAPSVTNGNVTIFWKFNEEASAKCKLQTPTDITKVPCNNSWTGSGLTEGYHSIYVTGTDLENNKGDEKKHTWRVDLTQPSVTISQKPAELSNSPSHVINFFCSEYCTAKCSLHLEGANPVFKDCSGSSTSNYKTYSTGTLQTDKSYVFQVVATDMVGNEGSAVSYKWRTDLNPPNIQTLVNKTIVCGNPYHPNVTGTPTVTDGVDPDPSLTYKDTAYDQCGVKRIWSATDAAGNTATSEQVISFTSPGKPAVTFPSFTIVACGELEHTTNEKLIPSIVVVHPCDLPTKITYVDPPESQNCDVTFTRQWKVVDDCGADMILTQTIQVLQLQLPTSPSVGQKNMDLQYTLRWPIYPGSKSYKVYVWKNGLKRPSNPVSVTSYPNYTPPTPLPPATQMSWQIEYILTDNSVIPSPQWGFETKTFVDLSVTSITLPPIANSGQDFDISYTVKNTGNLTTTTNVWYDAVYISFSKDFGNARRTTIVKQNNLIFPDDGYSGKATVSLRDSDIGVIYVFVETDFYRSMDDFDRNNNRLQSTGTMNILLTPPPDLRVDDVTIPTSSYSGEEIKVRWTVKNHGTGTTAATTWYDRIYWSTDPSYNTTDQLLKTYVRREGLLSDTGYTQIQTISVPRKINGEFYIVIKTDAYNHVYEHLNEENNVGASKKPITITLTPPPDLKVKSITCPSSIATGDTLKVTWSVENVGSKSPYSTYWSDRVELISTMTGGTFATLNSQFYGTLKPSNAYDRSAEFSIGPNIPSGKFNVSLSVDYTGRVFEFTYTENNNAIKELEVIQLLPDLTVDNVNVTLHETVYNSRITVSWEVKNIGKGRTLLNTWYDSVNIVPVNSNGVFTEQNLKTIPISFTESISSGASYLYNVTVTLPQLIHGDAKVVIETDELRSTADTARTNNKRSSLNFNIPFKAPDLTVTDFSLPTGNLYSGQEIILDTTIKNIKSPMAEAVVWTDRLILSQDKILTSPAIATYHNQRKYQLLSNATYTANITLVVPKPKVGKFYLHFTANAGEKLFEGNIINNNLKILPIFVEAPPSPDLTVDDISFNVRDIALDRRIIDVTWKGTNQGNSMLAPITWKDVIILKLSSNEINTNYQNSDILGRFTVSAALETSSSYTREGSFVIPEERYGLFDLCVLIDEDDDTKEFASRGNNIKCLLKKVQINAPPKAELSVQDLITAEILPELIPGNDASLSYRVTNDGARKTKATSWIDKIFISPFPSFERNEILQNGIILIEKSRVGWLDSGDSYTVNVTATIPLINSNEAYLYFVPDVKNVLTTSSTFSVSRQRTVSTDSLSDLDPTLNTTASEVSGGQPFQILYSVWNNGKRDIDHIRYDSVYLSSDFELDAFDKKLGANVMSGIFSANTTREYTITVFLPFDLPTGNYFLILEIDTRNDIYEFDEGNNRRVLPLTIIQTVSSDIAVVDVGAPESASVGGMFTVTWSLRNNGTQKAVGYKCDTVYLSSDEKWDITDRRVDDPFCSALTISPYKSSSDDQQYKTKSEVPFVSASAYNVIVKSRTNIKDNDLENNVGRADNLTEINVPILNLDTSITLTLNPRQIVAYRIPGILSDQTIIITTRSNLQDNFNSLKVRHNEMATTYDFDLGSVDQFLSNQTLVIANTNFGDYYVLLEHSGSLSKTSSPAQITILAKLAKFEILGTSPKFAAPLGNATLKIEGTLFPERLAVYLTNGTLTITAVQVIRLSSTLVFATFDIKSTNIGNRFNIKFVSFDRNITFPDALEIRTGKEGQAVARVTLPSFLRPGEKGLVYIDVQNIGDTDIIAPLLLIESKGIGKIRHVTNTKITEFRQRHIMLAGPQDGLGGLLIPQQSSRLTFQVKQNELENVGTMQISAVLIRPSDSVEHLFLEMKNDLKPSHYNEDAWNVVWDNFLGLVGHTGLSFINRVSQVVNKFSEARRHVQDVENIVSYLLDLADGKNTDNYLLRNKDISSSNEVDRVRLDITRTMSTRVGFRYMDGAFGKGWISRFWDTKLKVMETNQTILTYEKTDYVFGAESLGVYVSTALGTITTNGTDYTFVDRNAETMYTFAHTTGQLTLVSSNADRSSIALSYDKDNRLTELKHSSGEYVTVTYNRFGKVSTTILNNPDDGRTQKGFYLYDSSSSKLITVVDSEEKTTSYEYNDQGALASVSYPDETSMAIEYNKRGRVTSRKAFDSGQLQQSMEYNYNEGGGLSKTLWPDVATFEYILDEDGNVVAIKRDAFLTNRWEHHVNTKTMYQGDSVVSKEIFNIKSNSVRLEDGNRDSIEIQYDEYSSMKKLLDGEGNAYELHKFGNGSVDKYVFPDSSFEEFKYSQSSITLRSRNKEVKTFELDSKGRVVHKAIGSDDSTSYLYNSNGIITEAENALGKVEMSFDSRRLPKTVRGPRSTSLDYTFNIKGLKTRIKSSDGYDVQYYYNQNDQLTRVVNNVDSEELLKVAYDDRLRVKRKSLGNGAYVSYEYDDKTGMLKKLTNFYPDGSVASRFEYTYDARQRRISMNTTDGEWVFRYDSSGQVTFIQRPDGHTTEYSYDKKKNRKGVTTNGKTLLYKSNNLNQYTGIDNGDVFNHDLNGNLKSKSGTRPGQYVFDAENKLKSFKVRDTECFLKYDALDNLQQKSCNGKTQHYLLDIHGSKGPDVLSEYIMQGPTEERTSYFYGGDQLGLVAMKNNDGYFFYQFDPIGTVVAILSENGTLTNSYKLDPFGQILSANETIQNPFIFVGQWGVMRFEEMPEMYYMRARFYDSDTGKFLSVDPLGIHGKSKNFYAYVYNNPIHFNDPKGTIANFIIGGLISVGVDTAFKLATGEEVTWGGAASALVTGMIGGGFSGPITSLIKGTGLKALGKYYVKTHFNIPVNMLNALVGSVTESLIDGKPFGDVFGNNLINGLLTSFIPGTRSDIADALIGKLAPFLLRDGFQKRLDKLKERWQKIGDVLKKLVDDAIQWILSRDPNDMIGPDGYGAAKFISTSFVMEYKIRYENDANATAPAQRVYIEHTFDDDLDPRTFKVGTFGFGSYTHELPMDRSTLQVSIDLTAEHKIFLNVRGGLDIVNGKASWEFQSVDPATGEAPTDPSLGFLPPNNGTTGQGFVTFSIQPKTDAGSLAQIDAVASIYFDKNEPIDTPVIFNTIDSTAPVMNASVITETISSGVLAISLTNLDVGSGVKEVDILQKQDSGYTLLLTGISETIAVLPLKPGEFYELIPSPVDYVGNRNSLQSGQTLSVYFPADKVSCQGVNNCSSNGNCSGVDICICNPGRYGPDCSRTIPPPEPPILEVTTSTGIENTPFSINMRARLLEGKADEIFIIIKGYPQGFLFDKGERFADYVKVPAKDFGSLKAIPPPGYFGTFDLTVIANATTNGTSTERSNVLKVAVAKVLDVKLHLVPSCYINDSKENVSFSVSIEADSGEGMTYQSIRLMVPSMLVMVDGYMVSEGEYAVNESDLNRTFVLNSSNNTISGAFSVNITIKVLENLVPAVMTDSVAVQECIEETTTMTDMTSTLTSTNAVPSTTASSSNQTLETTTSTQDVATSDSTPNQSSITTGTASSAPVTISSDASTQSASVTSTDTSAVTSNVTSTDTSAIAPNVTSTDTSAVTSNVTPTDTSGVTSNVTPNDTSTIAPDITSTDKSTITSNITSTDTSVDITTASTTDTQSTTSVTLTTTTLKESEKRTSVTTRFDLNFNQDLQDTDQSAAVAASIKEALMNFFRIFFKILDIIIRSMRRGSLIVDYDIITANSDSNSTQNIPRALTSLLSRTVKYNGTNVTISAIQVKAADGSLLNLTTASTLCSIHVTLNPCAVNHVCIETDGAVSCKYKESEDDLALVLALAVGIGVFFLVVIAIIMIRVCSARNHKNKPPDSRMRGYPPYSDGTATTTPDGIPIGNRYPFQGYVPGFSRPQEENGRPRKKHGHNGNHRSKENRPHQATSSHKRHRSFDSIFEYNSYNAVPGHSRYSQYPMYSWDWY